MPEVTYIPRLGGASAEALALHENILFELDRITYHEPALNAVKALIKKLEKTGDFNQGANLQKLSCMKLQVRTQEKGDPTGIARDALQAMRITAPHFAPKQYHLTELTALDPQLVRIYAAARSAAEPDAAARLLKDSLKQQPNAPGYLTLAEILAAQKKPDEAVRFCITGSEHSVNHNYGKYNPDFALHKAILCNEQRDFMHAFFGFSALGRKKDAAKAKKRAEDAGIDFPTYKVETIHYTTPEFTLGLGPPVAGTRPGEYIARFRASLGMTQEELCHGICSAPMLSKIESGENAGTFYQLEAFMERLGRYTDYYFDIQLSGRMEAEVKLRNEARSKAAKRQPDEAEQLLHKLKKSKNYQKGPGRQFVLATEAIIYGSRNKRDGEYIKMLKEAWRETKKRQDIDTAYRERLTNIEVAVLNQMASYFCNNGERERAIQLFDNLRLNLKYHCHDERERIRSYIMVSNNLTTSLARAKNYGMVLEVITEIENLCIKYGHLHQAYRLAGNKASALIGLGREEEAKPYMAIAYYGAEILGYEKSKTAAAKYAAEKNLDLEFI